MKKIFIIIVIFLLSLNLNAQYNDIKINVFGAVIPALNLTYQRTLNKNFTTAIGIDIGRYAYTITTGYGTAGSEISFQRISYGLVGEFRAYPSKKQHAPKGFFTGIHIRDFIVEEIEPDITVTNNVFNAGLNFGYQWIWGNFTMELMGGYGFSKALSIDPDRNLLDLDNQDDLNEFGMARFQFCIGFVFPYFSD